MINLYNAIILITIISKLVLCSPTFSTYPEKHHHNWTRSEKLDPNGILNIQWYLRDNEIVFQVVLNSRGFAAIGFAHQSPRKGFDAVLAWKTDKTGKDNILVIISFSVVMYTRNVSYLFADVS